MRLDLYGTIGDPVDGVDEKAFIETIHNLPEAEPIDLHINSPGGFVYQGMMIYNALAARTEYVTVTIDAWALSMASVIAMAGSRIIMPKNSMMMIHNPHGAFSGDADDLLKGVNQLRQMETTIARVYAKKSGQPLQTVLDMMAAETWLTADDALALGFADEITEAAAIAAFKRIDLRAATYRIPSPIKSKCGVSEREVQMPNKRTSRSDNPNHAAAIAADANKSPKDTATEIRSAVRAAKLESSFADELIQEGVTMDAARERIIAKWSEQDRTPEPRNHVQVLASYDDPNSKVQAMSEALAARYIPNAQPSGMAREFMGASLMDMAQEILRARGEYKFGMSRTNVIKAAHTTSDFPELLQGAGNRILLSAYEEAPSGIKPLSRERTANDFRPLTNLRLGDAPELLEVKEGAEVTHGTTAEAAESYRVKTYARIFSLTREAIVNDDLGAFNDWMTRMGRAAAERESSLFWELLNSNPTMGEDNTALFHADHGNLAAAGAAISVSSLNDARKALRTVTGLDGKTPINATPAYLVVGPENETTGEQVLASLAAAKMSDVNPFSGRLQLLVEPRMGASNAWYVFAAPNTLPVFEHAYLSQAIGPQLETRAGFEIMGMEFRVSLDFGAGVVDWRGAYQNPGV